MIEEKQYWDIHDEQNAGFDWDTQSSWVQFSRIFTRPLVTDNVAKQSRFTNWRGRLISLMYLGKTLVADVFGVVKNLIVLIYLTALMTLEGLNFAFSKSARNEFFLKFSALIGSVFGLAMRPIAAAMDILRLSGGFLIHPAMAIGEKQVI